MGRQCQVCRKSAYANPNLSFHRFPVDPERKMLWLKILGMESKVLPKRSDICCEHFDEHDFTYRTDGLRVLTKNAAPKRYTVLPFFSQGSSSRPLTEFPLPLQSSEIMEDETSCLPKDDYKNENNPPQNIYQGVRCMELDQPSSSKSEYQPAVGAKSSILQVDSSSESLSSELPFASSSTTSTASEAERQILHILKDTDPNVICENLVGPKSGFRGKLSLVTKAEKRKRNYIGELSSDDFATQPRARKSLKLVKDTVAKQRRKIKLLQNTVRRLRARIKTLNDLLKHLRDKMYITESSEATVKASLTGGSLDLFERMLKGPTTQKYNASLRSFALTLAFYSPRAYNVRSTFNRSLPHLATIAKWYKTVDGSPGFTKEALVALTLKSHDAAQKGKKLFVIW